MKDGLKEIVGKNITGVVVANNTRSPTQQVFLTFSDGTYFEFWGESFSCSGALDRGDHKSVVNYVQRAGGTIETRYGLAAEADQRIPDADSRRQWVQASGLQGKTMSNTGSDEIQKFVSTRGIEALIHFTRVENVPGILVHGLLGRQSLAKQGLGAQTNDQYRYDRVADAICASITFPNYKMFYSLQQSYPESDWAVLRIDPRVLWEVPCVYCAANAASNDVTCISLEDRMTLQALRAMFEDGSSSIKRGDLGIPDAFTTDPQAEVLILSAVDPSYIMNVNVNARHKIKDMSFVQKLFKPFSGKFKFYHDESLFTYRKDYEHWRRPQESSDDNDMDIDGLLDF